MRNRTTHRDELPTRRLAVTLAGAFALCGSTVNTATAGLPGFVCHELDARIAYRGVTVDPPHPRVGDRIDITFDVDVLVYSVGPSRLAGADPLLVGETLAEIPRRPAYHLVATRAGTATLHLALTYLTEDACENDAGDRFFRWGSYHNVDFPAFDVVITGQGSCPGDCDASGGVTVDEIIQGTRVALAEEPIESCAMLDRDDDGSVTVDDVVAAVYAALYGCP